MGDTIRRCDCDAFLGFRHFDQNGNSFSELFLAEVEEFHISRMQIMAKIFDEAIEAQMTSVFRLASRAVESRYLETKIVTRHCFLFRDGKWRPAMIVEKAKAVDPDAIHEIFLPLDYLTSFEDAMEKGTTYACSLGMDGSIIDF